MSMDNFGLISVVGAAAVVSAEDQAKQDIDRPEGTPPEDDKPKSFFQRLKAWFTEPFP